MLTPQSSVEELRIEKAMPEEPPRQSSDPTPILVRSTTLLRETELPLHIHTIGSNTPLLINALIDSGATGKFIDMDYIRSKNLCTQCLPRTIPVYNVDGTLNDAGYITGPPVKMLNSALHYSTITERRSDIGFRLCAAPTSYSCLSISGV